MKIVMDDMPVLIVANRRMSRRHSIITCFGDGYLTMFGDMQ
ncbi:MAG TPA: hypothetical protein VNN22_01995 [Verrucomicrobiae bacterium]|nr:hypothetical protein [Verrucomicrobiae bacterium]